MLSDDPPQRGLTSWAKRFLSNLDHVGSTMHLEGLGLHAVCSMVRAAFTQLGLDYREEADAQGDKEGEVVFVSKTISPAKMYVWVTVRDTGHLITVLETRVIHTATELSALADELLVEFTSAVESQV